MAFNPSSFALTQLLSQANTASKSTDPTTTTTSTATDMSAAAAAAVAADAFRMMHANGSFGPAFGAGGFPGAGGGGQLDASAFRAMAASNGGGSGSGGMPAFAGMYPGIGPNGELLSGGGGPNGMQGFYYDALGGYPYGGGLDLNGQRRKNATRETTQPLKHWLYEHRKNPYPTKGEKIMLAIMTKMTLTQVSTWFANARRRLKKENKMTWSPRNRPGDDDDDLADDANDRPSSSLSDLSDIGNAAYDAALSRIKESAEIKAETNNNHHHTGIKRRTSSPPTSTTTSPIKKNKIWSIAATLDGGATDDIVATASTSSGGVGESKSTSESLLMQQQQHAMMDNGGGGSSMISSPFAYAFSPWHQQMAAMAAASRCASANQQQFAHHPLLAAAHFRPELLAMMSRNPGVAFLPSGMLLPSSMAGANQQWPMPPIVVDHQQRRPSTSPTSSTHSHQHHRDNASKEAATVDKSS